MIGYETLKTLITTNWGLAPGQIVPTIKDMDDTYETIYPNVVFLKMYDSQPTKSLAAAGLVVMSIQIIEIRGVYTTFALADAARTEIIRIVHANKYRISDNGTIIKTNKRHVFSIICKYIGVLS